ncbi:hypothetical protein FOXYSP1_03205 [Fusarium oxysporum f. sp. phaseoli]
MPAISSITNLQLVSSFGFWSCNVELFQSLHGVRTSIWHCFLIICRMLGQPSFLLPNSCFATKPILCAFGCLGLGYLEDLSEKLRLIHIVNSLLRISCVFELDIGESSVCLCRVWRIGFWYFDLDYLTEWDESVEDMTLSCHLR